jgi:fatty-acyl-CoA synthase
MTAVGKVYKPRLRAEATRHAMAAQLAQRGLMERVEVDVEETAGGLSVRFTTADPAAEATIRELMKPFALSFSIAQGASR